MKLGCPAHGDGAHDPCMTSLLITHTVTDLAAWSAAFSAFDELRAQGGVTSVQTRHRVDDPNHVAIDLEFGTTEEARAFQQLLETQVWPSSPHLGGTTPETLLLEPLAALT